MKGTDKQVKWAEDIKARYISLYEMNSSPIEELDTAFRNWADSKDARFWIDFDKLPAPTPGGIVGLCKMFFAEFGRDKVAAIFAKNGIRG